MEHNITVDKAINYILSHTSQLYTEKVFLNKALNRVIAEEIFANMDIPPFDNSAMDGFAIKAEDTIEATKENPVKLKIIDEAPAGKIVDICIKNGETVKIMTGGKLPEGSDAILRKEDVEEKNGYIYIFNKVNKGQDIRERGEDIKNGSVVIKKGEVLTPANIGILASLGKSFVEVYRKPVVTVIVTGDEIVDIDSSPIDAQIRNSNGFTLMALLQSCNVIFRQTKIIRDSKDLLITAIKENINSDIILSTGGVSMGDYDFVKDVVQFLGFEPIFWKVKVKPGRPLFFAKKDKTLYFGIPGNPVSTMTTFYNFILPSIRKMQGFSKLFLKEIEATLLHDIKRKSNRVEFIRGVLTEKNGEFFVESTGPQGSGILSSMQQGNCFIIADETASKFQKGDKVKVKIFDAEFYYE